MNSQDLLLWVSKVIDIPVAWHGAYEEHSKQLNSSCFVVFIKNAALDKDVCPHTQLENIIQDIIPQFCIRRTYTKVSTIYQDKMDACQKMI
jgi:hypothetical protein